MRQCRAINIGAAGAEGERAEPGNLKAAEVATQSRRQPRGTGGEGR